MSPEVGEVWEMAVRVAGEHFWHPCLVLGVETLPFAMASMTWVRCADLEDGAVFVVTATRWKGDSMPGLVGERVCP